ncbi:hypothetical protein [Propionicicella superfundia]|uniref:hypothetical protein n=1 Tax=Propionicicella superfundia TaxID=348582 RepID=UPI00048A8687|nr:hypothetical protein [Propionicicella superfundia]
MTDEWSEIEAIVATTHRVEKYGGIRLSDSALADIADGLNSGGVPFQGHHDPLQPIRTRDLHAEIVTLSDGERAVRLTGFVHTDDWAEVGDVHGMSFATIEPLGRADGINPDAESIELSADAAWFDDDTIAAACSIMSAVATTNGNRLYQFSVVDDARMVLELGMNFVIALGPDLAASAVWDGVKLMLMAVLPKRRKLDPAATTRIELRTPLPGGEVVAVIDTPDIETAKQAISAYSQAVEAAAKAAKAEREVVAWSQSPSSGGWVSGKAKRKRD